MNRTARAVVVIPTYNERDNIAPLISAIQKIPRGQDLDLHILVVDDSSPDGTGAVVRAMAARDPRIHLLVRPGKQGLGSAYLAGFDHAITTLDASYLVQIDADLSHPPGVIPRLLRPLHGDAELALGSRYTRGGGARAWPVSRRLVSTTANILVSILLRLRVRDATSGFRALTAPVASLLIRAPPRSSGFAFQVESLCRARRAGRRIVEVPFVFRPRLRGRTKLSGDEVLDFAATLLRLAHGKW